MKKICLILGVTSAMLVACSRPTIVREENINNDVESELQETLTTEPEVYDFNIPLSEAERKIVGFGNASYFYTYTGTEMADELIETMKFKNFDLTLPIDWASFDAMEDRDIPYRLNSFKFMSCLIEAYEDTQDPKYKDLAMDFIMGWIDVHPAPFEGSEWAWHDDATGRRTFLFSVAYALWGDELPEDQRERLEESLRLQVELLATDEFYTYRHNHGMFQDQAIALYALILETGDRQKELMNLAKERSLDYFRYSIAEDGVHKEHSPSYHYEMVDAVHWFGIVYQTIDPEFSKEMLDLEQKMAKYATHITMPNGYTPSIGDSAKRIYDHDGWEDNEAYMYAVTSGKEGEPSEETMVVFEEGGYGIMRSDWLDSPEEATWMMLSAATHSGTHKHNDDLNFLLYHKGELFVEAGNRNYNYLEPYTRYVYESYAHNVLLINDEPFKMGIKLPSINDRAKLTRITDYNKDGDVQWVQGSQQRFSGIEQIRTLEYDKKNSVVKVIDKLESTKKAESRLLYHLAPDITIKPSDNGWLLYRGEELTATVSVTGSGILELSSIYGEEDPESPYKGLIFDGNTTSTEGHVLIVDMPVIKGTNTIEFTIQLH